MSRPNSDFPRHSDSKIIDRHSIGTVKRANAPLQDRMVAGMDVLQRCKQMNVSRANYLRLNEDIYERIGQVGEGTYGKVFKAKNRRTGELVALKIIRMEQEREGFPFTATREIKLLTDNHHSHIVSLREIISYATLQDQQTPPIPTYTLVFDYMEHDLTGLLSHPTQETSHTQIPRDAISHPHFFSPRQTKCLFQQLLSALEFLHQRRIIHRDIKSSNLLISSSGVLKLADFGLARDLRVRKREERAEEGDKQSQMTNRVITLWYRPPELLLGATQYGGEIDMWSAGCILLELYTRQAVFLGGDELSQMAAIIRILGYPKLEGELAKVAKGWKWLSSGPRLDLRRLVPEDQAGTERGGLEGIADEKRIPPLPLDLIQTLLDYNPMKRPTAAEALKHPWFQETHPMELPCPDGQHEPILVAGGEWHEWEMKWRKRGGLPPESQTRKSVSQSVAMDAPFPEANEPFKPERAADMQESRRDDARKRRPSSPVESANKKQKRILERDVIKTWMGRLDGYTRRSTTGR